MTKPTAKRETRYTPRDAILIIVLFLQWTLCMGAVLHREWSHFSTEGPPVGRDLVRQHENFSYRRMGIYRDTRRIGFTETTIRPEKDNAVIISTRTEATFNLFHRTPLKLHCTSTLLVDSTGEPQHLFARLGVPQRPDLNVDLEGMRQGDRMHVIVKQIRDEREEILFRETIPVQGSAEVDTGLVPLGDLPGLTDGREWAVRYVNPLTRRTQHGKARVTGRETISWQDREVETFRVEVDFDGSRYLQPVAHIATDGRLLTLDGIAGYRFVREPRPESPSHD